MQSKRSCSSTGSPAPRVLHASSVLKRSKGEHCNLLLLPSVAWEKLAVKCYLGARFLCNGNYIKA